MKAKWAKAMLDAMDYIQENVSKLTIPYLLVHGDDDQLVKMEGSHFLHDNSPSTDKTFKVTIIVVLEGVVSQGGIKLGKKNSGTTIDSCLAANMCPI